MITESFSEACCKAVKVTFETLYPTFKWVAVDDAPETFKALMWAANSGEPVPINGVSGDDNLYRSADYNIMFRAWHDAVHIRTGLRFTTQDEIAVAHVQYHEMRCCGVAEDVAIAVRDDVIAQALYYQEHKQFVNDQLTFMNRVLEHGAEAAVKMGVI